MFSGKRVENSSARLLEGTDELALNCCNLINEVFDALPEHYGISGPAPQKSQSQVVAGG